MKIDTQKLSAAPEPSYQRLGTLLKELRLQSTLSQPDVATRMGVTQQTVSRWEAGLSRPRSNQISGLAALFNFDSDDLLTTAEYGTKKTALTSAQPFPVDALSWENFERFCTHLVEALYPGAKVHQEGTIGSDQDGLDIKAVLTDGTSFSFQCKRVNQFGPADVQDAIVKHTADATHKIIVLSRIASPKARRVLEVYKDWDIWDKEDISRRIRSLPKDEQVHLVDVFFRGQREALIGETEIGPWQKANDVFIPIPPSRSPFHHEWQLVGREKLISSIADSLELFDPPIKILVGAGGAGKTRILKEVVSEFEHKHKGLVAIRFAASHSEITPKSLNIMGTRRKLLIVDDAHERSDLESLFCFAAVPENNTVVLLATRPYGLQLIKGVASKYGLSESSDFPIELFGLEEAQSLSHQVLASFNGPLEKARAIAKITVDCPLATVFASYVVAKEGSHPELALNHPQFRSTLLDRFQKIITGSIGTGGDAQLMEKIMRVVALVQPFSPEDESVFQLISDVEQVSSNDSKRAIRVLSEAGLLFKRSGKCRLSPDMLADFILEKQCIADGGRSTGYAEKIFDYCGKHHLKNLLVNLGKLDWRLTAKDGQTGRFLDDIWGKLEPRREYADPYILAVGAAAYYQPERALSFADDLIRKRAFLPQLPELIRNAAYSYGHLKHACESLWAIGKDDDRELSQHPNHAIRVLKKLCEFSPFQPLSYNGLVVDFAINLAKQADSFNHIYSPFDILNGLLETKIHRAVSTKDGLIFEQYNVPPEAVAPLRSKVIDCAIDHLSHSKVGIATSAAMLLRDALRYPVSRAYNDEWSHQFEETLLKIESAIEKIELTPPVYIALVNAISWHQKYGSEQTSSIAKRIAEQHPTNLEFRIFRAMMHGWESYLGTENSKQANKELAEALLTDLFNECVSPTSVCNYLETQLGKLNQTGNRNHSAGVLIHMIVDRNPAIAPAMANFAIDFPGAELAKFVDIPVAKMLRDDPSLGLSFAEKLLNSESPYCRKSVGLAYWRCGRLVTELSIGDLKIIKSILSSDDESIVSSAFNLLRVMTFHSTSAEQARLVIDLTHCIKLDMHPSLAETILDFISTEGIFSNLDQTDTEYFFQQLMPIAVIDSYSIQLFLSHLSKQQPVETAAFLMRRVEFAVSSEDGGYAPYNKGAYETVQLHFRESAEFSYLLHTVLEWLKSREDKRFRRYGCELFEYMFSPIDETILPYLSDLMNSATQNDMVLICEILNEAGAEFVLRQSEFIVNFLNKAENFSKDVLEFAIRSLYLASISGVKSGEFGKPFDQDLEIAKSATAILDQIPRFAPAYKLYDLLTKHAENEIQRSLKEYQEADFDE